MLDYHVHLWPHDERADSLELRIERLAEYCRRAEAEGVREIALTEHLFRFRVVRERIGPFWSDDPNPAIAAQVGEYWDHHATADLDEYVESALAAQAAGLPVVVGLEVDYYPGRMDEIAAILAGYPFDVLLGSVHWLGNWMFDVFEGAPVEEWDRRDLAEAWRLYATCLEELAGTGTCDVLAHPDLIKVAGRRPAPSYVEEVEERIAAAAAASGMAAEISSNGWTKPVNEQYPSPSLLAKLFRAGVPVTTASDTHGIARVAARSSELRDFAAGAGYETLRAFSARRGRDVPLSPPAVESELARIS